MILLGAGLKSAEDELRSYGPFHRKKSPTQDYATALLQQESQEIWGKPQKNGGQFPKVKAYLKPLCAGTPSGVDCADNEGVEFSTLVKPSQRLPSGMVLWSLDSAQPGLRQVDDETIALSASVYKLRYSEEEERVAL